MTDQELWSRGAALLQAEFGRLPAAVAGPLSDLAGQVREGKRDLFAISAAAQGESLCTECGGVCCGRGKYHPTAVDLLVLLASGQPLFTPDFASPICPYLGSGGCLMTPEFRPLTCVIFLCDAVAERLAPPSAELFRRREAALREQYRAMDRLFGRRLTGSFLLAVERTLASSDRCLLTGAP